MRLERNGVLLYEDPPGLDSSEIVAVLTLDPGEEIEVHTKRKVIFYSSVIARIEKRKGGRLNSEGNTSILTAL